MNFEIFHFRSSMYVCMFMVFSPTFNNISVIYPEKTTDLSQVTDKLLSHNVVNLGKENKMFLKKNSLNNWHLIIFQNQLFVWIRVLIFACRHVAICIPPAFSASDRTFQTMLSTVTAFWIAVCLWLYSISDHCFDDLTNYRQNCYSSIVDGIVFASDVKCCTLSYFASVSSSKTMDRWGIA
jgi:hypothetical protein